MSRPSENAESSETTNVVVLRGEIRGEPVERVLPSGGVVVQFDVAARLDGSAAVAPVSLSDPSKAALACIEPGASVVVFGGIRRRFFRVDGRTQSRTEVVARRVVATRRRAGVDRLLSEAIAAIEP